MGGVIDWLIEKYRADIILIPHVVQVNRDDFEMANELREVVKNKEFVSIVDKTRNALELKGIISHCDLILASRMHASIAALSTGVPVVGIAYSHKMKGIFSLMGVESVIDIVDLDWDITEVITKTLSDAERIRRALIPEVEKMKQKAELPAEKVAELLGA
jgi:polysaccharide pyruvyl transferase WcaK-like protein